MLNGKGKKMQIEVALRIVSSLIKPKSVLRTEIVNKSNDEIQEFIELMAVLEQELSDSDNEIIQLLQERTYEMKEIAESELLTRGDDE